MLQMGRIRLTLYRIVDACAGCVVTINKPFIMIALDGNEDGCVRVYLYSPYELESRVERTKENKEEGKKGLKMMGPGGRGVRQGEARRRTSRVNKGRFPLTRPTTHGLRCCPVSRAVGGCGRCYREATFGAREGVTAEVQRG